jgi:hypothetical protein
MVQPPPPYSTRGCSPHPDSYQQVDDTSISGGKASPRGGVGPELELFVARAQGRRYLQTPHRTATRSRRMTMHRGRTLSLSIEERGAGESAGRRVMQVQYIPQLHHSHWTTADAGRRTRVGMEGVHTLS